jgi:hypothetical protein
MVLIYTIALSNQKIITLWLFNIAMENGSFLDDFPIKTSIYWGFSMAMLNNQRVVDCNSPRDLLRGHHDSPSPI